MIEASCVAKNMPIIPFKGATLRRELYLNPAFRPSGDIDLLVQKRHALSAIEVLEQLGYQTDPLRSRRQQCFELKHQHSLSFIHCELHAKVDLHTEIIERRFGAPLPSEQLFRKARRRNGRLRMDPCLDGLVLLLHGAKHNWRELIWLMDLCKLAQLTKFDSSIRAAAVRHGLGPLVDSAGCLLRNLFGLKLAAFEPVAKNREIERIANYAAERICRPASSIFLPNDLRIHRCMRDSQRGKLRYLLERICVPNQKDFSLMRIPDCLFPLYFVLRPIRLLFEYSLRLMAWKRAVRHMPTSCGRLK